VRAPGPAGSSSPGSVREARRPTRRALASSRKTSHSMTPNTTMSATPIRAAPTARPALCPVTASRTTATIGSPNLNPKFQTPVVTSAVLTATLENPKLPNIR
jgi:hypothetical protein